LIIWVDAQLSPALAPWLNQQFGVDAVSIRRLGLLEAKDPEIFSAAREASAIVLTKDVDFVILLERLGPPPRVLWVTCGNTTNEHLRQVLGTTLPNAIELLNAGEILIEISDIAKNTPA
jgi:predicted nuclease of predicted toxin-antitoxin system